MTRSASFAALVRCFTLSVACAVHGSAQCDPYWLPGDPVREVIGYVTRMVSWDPDGAGPAPFSLTICGEFSVGSIAHGTVAYHDGTAWQAIGTPPSGRPSGMAVYNGQLVVAFVDVTRVVAAWNGTSWQTLGTFDGPLAEIEAFATYQGALVAGGNFTTIGGVTAAGIAQWNGASWSPLGGGVGGGEVRALAVFNNSLHVGGTFNTVNGATQLAYGIWNGSAWAPAPSFNGTINALAARIGTTLASSFLFAGGEFSAVNNGATPVPALRVARFTPSTNTWAAMGNLNEHVTALLVRSTGVSSYEVSAARADFSGHAYVHRWDGTNWIQLGSWSGTPGFVSLLYQGGSYTVARSGELGAASVLRLVGGVWQVVDGPGTDRVSTAVVDGGSDVVIGGAFGVLRGGPGAWSSLGAGVVGTVRVLARMPNGDIVAGGALTQAGGSPAGGVARWNGTAWSSLAGGVNGTVASLLPLPNGELIAGGTFTTAGGLPAANVARWTGSAWVPLSGGTDGEVRSLAALPSGDVVACGTFTFTGSFTNSTPRIARWNGTAWSAMTAGTGFNGAVDAVVVDASGQLIAAGAFTTLQGAPMSRLAKWNGGTSWTEIPGAIGPVAGVLPLANGEYLLSDPFFIVRTSVPPVTYLSGGIAGIAAAGNGDVLVAGEFTVAGDVVSQGYARLTTPCPATAATAGAGCAGSTLVATSLPWVGGTFRAAANGLPSPAIALHVTGFAPVLPPLPLAAVLPQALPGCLLHVSADFVDASVALGGIATSQIVLPPTPSLVGAQFRHQVVALQVDAALAVVGVTATNALLLTIGEF